MVRKLQNTGRQFNLSMPMKFVNELNWKKHDRVELRIINNEVCVRKIESNINEVKSDNSKVELVRKVIFPNTINQSRVVFPLQPRILR